MEKLLCCPECGASVALNTGLGGGIFVCVECAYPALRHEAEMWFDLGYRTDAMQALQDVEVLPPTNWKPATDDTELL
jgi:hypothetical protein